MKLQNNILDDYIGGSVIRHKYYKDTVTNYEELKDHFDGTYREELLDVARPGESPLIKKYRKDIFQSPTKSICSKVITVLQKIWRSPDWSIRFPEEKNAKIVEGEDLESYLMYNFPRSTSFVNWFFKIGLKQYLTDSNGIILMMPENINRTSDLEYYRPMPVIFNSDQIIDYSLGKFYILRSNETVSYVYNSTTYSGGFVYYTVNDTHLQRFEQTSPNMDYAEVLFWDHNIGIPPIVDLHGIVVEATETLLFAESRISPMVPFLNEVMSESSDLKGSLNQHMHPTMWFMPGQECKKCNGAGKIPKGNNLPAEQCPDCKGKGRYPFNPYEHFSVQQGQAGDPATTTPPAGFILKDIQTPEFMVKRIDGNIKKAYSAICMDHLGESPISESGIAKRYDDEGANNWVYSVAEDGVRILDDMAWLANEIRYSGVIPDRKKREEQLPTIYVPANFDMLSETYIVANLTAMKLAGVDASLINAAQKDLATKMFSTNEHISIMLACKFDLDPFAGVNDDTINANLATGLITEVNAVIHANIDQFLEMAMFLNKDFMSLPRDKKREILEGLAEEEMKKMQPDVPEPGTVIQMPVNPLKEVV